MTSAASISMELVSSGGGGGRARTGVAGCFVLEPDFDFAFVLGLLVRALGFEAVFDFDRAFGFDFDFEAERARVGFLAFFGLLDFRCLDAMVRLPSSQGVRWLI
jgi:hypothetical protein